jgi:hypothetical protein
VRQRIEQARSHDFAPRQHLRHDACRISDAETHAEQAGFQVTLYDEVRSHRLAATALDTTEDVAHHAEVFLVRAILQLRAEQPAQQFPMAHARLQARHRVFREEAKLLQRRPEG